MAQYSTRRFHSHSTYCAICLFQFPVGLLVRASDEEVRVSRLVFRAALHGSPPSSHSPLQQSSLSSQFPYLELASGNPRWILSG